MRKRLHLGVIEPVLEHRHQGFVDQGRLSASAHSAYAYQHAEREVHIHILQVVSPCSAYPERQAVALAALRRKIDGPCPVEIIQCGGRRSCDVAYRPVETDVPAFVSGSGTHIHQPVCRHHGFGVMFYYHHRVPLVPQLLERGYQLPVIPLMKSDGWLVKNIKHIDQLGPDLGGKPDPLALTS